MRAHEVLHRHSRQSPSECLHRTVAFVLKDAKDHTLPTPISKIDSQLGAISSPAVLKSGRLSKNKKKQNDNIAVAGPGIGNPIVVARMHPFSLGYRGGPGYNLLTGQKWFIDAATFSPGQGVRGFWNKVNQVAIKMVKSRHSSTGFFKISWNAVGQLLIPYLPATYRGAAETWFAANSGKKNIVGMGRLHPAQAGALSTTCTIENRMGMSGDNATLDKKRNEAMHRILGPILQTSINGQADKKMLELWKQDLLAQEKKLRALGMTLN